MKICAPFAGIVRYVVEPGATVATGDTLAMVETVKLEAPVVAPGPGVVGPFAFEDFADVTGGDVLLEVGEL
ncbi:acetyl-CoA carboxylase biotin carboxyl carrier protein subunit [Corynebacterium hindlerae]|uniref:Acetyl-CoA carboxylase biotin carboxyl carrier protein subunit n=1 Tax=Corynebacterium hindlerae TaxID=699041 RepID=A0A7G5FEY0_9CORY|nr:acetyl-CoA carboxylase biotin carboxyl carrier protein subunit [Corynebacterium hindlerae]QMV85171.1 acetyl-CoA carboxylase biotin carboxyl carrier protein subunit [Corynebacterium hindlerae]QTH58936.1 acetyl-CoA carboxylase biotin carboxyl carrier protein subunit [Corynebacterium hindlerae]